MTPVVVESTTLTSVAYDADRMTLQLEFRDKTIYGLKPRAATQSLRVLPTDVCPRMLDLLRVAVHASKQRPCGNALRATDVADGSARHEGLARPSFDRRLFVPLDIRAVDALDALGQNGSIRLSAGPE